MSNANTPAQRLSPKLKRMFYEDGRTMLQSLVHSVGQLQANPGNSETLNQVFRYAHSLKSEASFLKYEDVANSAHRLEECLSSPRRDSREVTEDEVAEVIELVYQLEQAFNARRVELADELGIDQAPSSEGANVVPQDGEWRFRLSGLEQDLLRDALARGERAYQLHFTVREKREFFYARCFLAVGNLEASVSLITLEPKLDDVTEGEEAHFHVLFTTAGNQEDALSALRIDSVGDIELSAVGDNALDEYAESAANEEYFSGILDERQEMILRLGSRSYDQLCLFSDELVYQLESIVRECSQIAGGEASMRLCRRLRTVRNLSQVTNQTVNQTSMISLRRVFHDLKGPVQGFAAKVGKDIDFTIHEASGRVFLPVAEVLTEVLIHLIYNAVDHGIEAPATRLRSGKSERGRVRVRSEARGGYLRISIEDDGIGIDEGLVRERAGVGSDVDLLDVISRAGFSTKDDASDYSGRGVGLDIVVHAINELLNGSLSMENEYGRGVTFTVELPQSIRLVSVLVLRDGEHVFSVPSSLVYGTYELDGGLFSTDTSGKMYYRHRGENLRVYSVGNTVTADRRFGLVLRLHTAKALLMVDELISEETIVRDVGKQDVVYSKTLGQEVPFVLPLRLLHGSPAAPAFHSPENAGA
jgi:two-component system chemotaxis sensor kinase CheA